jgi:hypothetical protein
MSNVGSGSPVLSDLSQEAGPWNEALSLLREWDPLWAGAAGKMMTNPWTSGVLPRKFVELVCVALNAACTSLNPKCLVGIFSSHLNHLRQVGVVLVLWNRAGFFVSPLFRKWQHGLQLIDINQKDPGQTLRQRAVISVLRSTLAPRATKS